jgi:lipopolysaccharide/colanic/teichoic acid biosynthesis glycosyltransferase
MYVSELTAAEFATRSVAGDVGASRTQSPSRLLLVISRMRFQLLFGVLFAVAIPALARGILEPTSSRLIVVDNSLFGTLCAFLLGYMMFRKVTGYPGVRATAYILPVFVAAYALSALGFMFLRLEYSRLQFLISFGSSVLAFYWIFIMVRRLNSMRLSVLPVGEFSRLLGLRFVKWRMLTSPIDMNVEGGIVVDMKADLSPEWERFIADRALDGTAIYDAKQVFESLSGRVQVEHLSENTFAALTPNSIYASGKRHFDFLLAACAFVFIMPALLLVALLVRVDSPGPALFRQERVGYRGRVFTVYKLRTMRVAKPGAETIDSQMTQDRDPRITRLGHFLRKSRIDELPQIINILRGEMSWIGPRPEAVHLSEWYAKNIPFYRYRHLVRPGITGWAQVNQGHVTTLGDADLKLQYDFFYVKNFSLWLDILVLLRTVKVVTSGSGAR